MPDPCDLHTVILSPRRRIPCFCSLGLLSGEKILSLVVPGLNDKYRAGDLRLYEQDTSHLSHFPTGREGQEYPHK